MSVALVSGKKTFSSGWKDINLKIFGTDEHIVLPVMVSSKVWDVKTMLAEMHGGVLPAAIDFYFKAGPSYKRHRNGDEVQSTVMVKGIKSFAKGDLEYFDPYIVIGAGFMGLRQAVHYSRKKVPYLVCDRKPEVGGNAWSGIGQKYSKLQTEGPQYQLAWDVFDKNIHGLLKVEKYGYWPSRDEIMAHLWEVCDEYGVSPHVNLNCELIEMNIVEGPPGGDVRQKYYEYHWKSTKPGDESQGIHKTCCTTYFPGCLVVPHRKTWPGEDVFAGNIGYGFAHEFPYPKVNKQDGVIIGMGAFAHENARTFVEHGGRKAYNIARHFNLLMPRIVCWWVNQSVCPPTAAMVLHSMEPMYDLIGMSPWNFFSVTANAERTVATIKQYTRWGISDILLLCMYWGKVEVIQGEVKRFKEREAVLNTGRVLEEIDNIIKVIGFDGDFGVDRLMKCKVNIGPWPSGDWRRFTLSDQSAIDASRFTNIAISPAVSSMSNMTFFFHTHPDKCHAALATGLLPENPSEPELGSPCYHYEPRKGTASMMSLFAVAPELNAFEDWNGRLKKASHHHIAGCCKYTQACAQDWYKYCKLFTDQGHTAKWPRYPYTAADAQELCRLEDDLAKQEEQKWMMRMGINPNQHQAQQQQQPEEQHEVGGEENVEQQIEDDPHQKLQEQQMQQQQQQQQQQQEQERDDGIVIPQFFPTDRMAFEPARKVLEQRLRARSPAKDASERAEWLKEGSKVKDWLVRHSSPSRAIAN